MVEIDKQLFLEKLGFMLAQKFAVNCPKKSTRMAQSFASTMKIENGEIVFTLPYYAKSVIHGSPPHEIKAKNAKSLAVPVKEWTGIQPNKYGSKKGFPMLSKDGKFVLLGKTVQHPGNAPNFFIQDTLHREFEDIAKIALKQSIKK